MQVLSREEWEGFNVIESQQVLEWQTMARIQTRCESILRVLELRFHAPAPGDVKLHLEATTGPRLGLGLVVQQRGP
jgi:hypothetical protein